MKLYSEKIPLLQAIESAVKSFFYKQVLVIVVGSLEAKGNRVVSPDSCDSLSQIFLKLTNFPVSDATFLGSTLGHELGAVRDELDESSELTRLDWS